MTNADSMPGSPPDSFGYEGDPPFAVGVAQFAPGRDPAENLARIRELAHVAVDRGASLVVFPEYSSFFTNPVGEELVAAAEGLDGPFVAGLSRLAVDLGVHIVAGMAERVENPGRFSNTVVAVSPAGEVVARYRKQHLYDAFGQSESDWVQPGLVTDPETFEVGGLTVGLQTCYDLRFPEVTRRLVDAGVELVLVPAEWVRGPLKEAHWLTLLTARAIENTVYIAAADHTPPAGVGNSAVLDPMGVTLAALGETTDVAVGWVSASRLVEVRAVNPALLLRRYQVLPL